MTTIAYRDGVLAADRLSSLNGVRIGYADKIALIDGKLFGSCGCSAYGRALEEWVRAGMVGDLPEGDGGGVVVHTDGRLELFEGKKREWAAEFDYYAWGSGGEIAKGAMALGATAEQAVAAAIKLDCYSGGDVTSLKLPERVIPIRRAKLPGQ